MIMKKHYESTVKGGGTSYSAPSVEILSISIEKGLPTALSWIMAEPAKQAAALMTPITENTNKHILRL